MLEYPNVEDIDNINMKILASDIFLYKNELMLTWHTRINGRRHIVQFTQTLVRNTHGILRRAIRVTRAISIDT